MWFFLQHFSVFPSFFFICFFLINTYSLCRVKTDAITSKSNLFNCWVGYDQPNEWVFTKTKQPFVELIGAINVNPYSLATATNLQKKKNQMRWQLQSLLHNIYRLIIRIRISCRNKIGTEKYDHKKTDAKQHPIWLYSLHISKWLNLCFCIGMHAHVHHSKIYCSPLKGVAAISRIANAVNNKNR